LLQDDQPMYENLEELRAMRTQGDKPPEPEENTEPVKQYSENWEQYNDEESGRPYYYNKETKDTSWKLPRGITVKVNNVQGNSDDASQRLMVSGRFNNHVSIMDSEVVWLLHVLVEKLIFMKVFYHLMTSPFNIGQIKSSNPLAELSCIHYLLKFCCQFHFQ